MCVCGSVHFVQCVHTLWAPCEASLLDSHYTLLDFSYGDQHASFFHTLRTYRLQASVAQWVGVGCCVTG